jgi:hypothetical protein
MPSFPAEQQMCKISFSPLRSPMRSPRRREYTHERNQSETVQRPRPISTAGYPSSNNTMTPMHAKRASIYVSDASILLQQRTPMVSPTSPADLLLSPTGESSDAVDHYAILEITPSASTDDVKAAYRRLRSAYFASDAKKYRALQAAFDTLMDPEARQAYDANYQARAAAPSSLSSIDGIMQQAKHGRQDSAHGDEPVILEEEEEIEDVRTDDPNWGLKRHQQTHELVLGSEPYMSYVPLPTRALPWCRQVVYVGTFARNALPN